MRNLISPKMSLIVFGFLVLAVAACTAQTFNSLLSLNGTNGVGPYYELLTQGTDGNFYGTTNLGGTNNNGSVFKITPAGALTTLYNFCSQPACTDGAYPYGALVQGTNGNFYGTASTGGANNGGTVFTITPEGALTTLYNFCAQADCNDGEIPSAGLVQAANGQFYGTTQDGGIYGGGTIFEITAAGVLTTTYNFCAKVNCTDGENPMAPLIQASNGHLYGTTYYGGPYTGGTVFEISQTNSYTMLRSFDRIVNGSNPYGGLVQGANGNFYGTMSQGGPNAGYAAAGGTVFEITPGGTVTVLYSFCAQTNCTDGSLADGGLVLGTDGNFYGTTQVGGTINGGTAFSINPSGALTTLYNFCSLSNCADGAAPYGGLLQATNGTFYGTTYTGGSNDDGSIYSVSTGLGPFVQLRPIASGPGIVISILGTNLTGATAVTFNGTPATFTVVSPTQITAKVPKTATTGVVQVTLPGGTKLSSNIAFRFIP
jgi:uncharacterized repeat protein (TIGR03803 family)